MAATRPHPPLPPCSLPAAATILASSPAQAWEGGTTAQTPPPPSPTSARAAVGAALAAYAARPKTGRPQPNEHTVLAAFVVERAGGKGQGQAAGEGEEEAFHTVALATGVKCASAAGRCGEGRAVADCHAEALARRALVAWLCDDLTQVAGGRGGSGLFGWAEGGGATAGPAGADVDPAPRPPFVRRPGWRLHLVVTALPCGDACVRPCVHCRHAPVRRSVRPRPVPRRGLGKSDE